jgi:hypothetical protein
MQNQVSYMRYHRLCVLVLRVDLEPCHMHIESPWHNQFSVQAKKSDPKIIYEVQDRRSSCA